MRIVLGKPRYFLKQVFTVRCLSRKCTALVLCGVLIYLLIVYCQEPIYVFVNRNTNRPCILPDIDPNDPLITKFYNWQPKPLECDSTPSLTLVDDAGYLRFNESVYNRFKHGDLECSYSIVNLVDDYHIKFQPEIPFKSPVEVLSDSFVVKCRNTEGKLLYENIHQKVDRKSVEKSRQIKNESDDDFSVFLFGIDSVSRLAAIRKLPKTVQYITKNLSGYVFNGFNKVGENTFPALVALLCGRLLSDFGRIDVNKDYADKFPLIYSDFQRKGYVTMLTEDWPEIATFSHSVKAGFKNPPTLHYPRAYWLGMRNMQPLPFLVDQVLMYLESKALKLRKSSSLCYGNRPNHVLVIDYVKRYLHTYKGKRRFFLSWLNELAHNYVNFLEYGDNDFMELIKWMHDNKHLERAFLMVLSDHGSRVDAVRNSYIGRIEDRMPFVSLVIPEVFRKKYPQIIKNLEENQKRLTTALDAHEMIRDILDKRYAHANFSSSEKEKSSEKRGSISLFRTISKTRSCFSANISDHCCACFSSQSLSISNPILKPMGSFVVENINQILLPVRNLCALLKVDTILDSSEIENRLKRRAKEEYVFTLQNWIFSPEERDETTYTINIRTVPGNATFEATVRRSGNGVMTIVDKISRTNRYGSQSKCIADIFLKNYCFCV